MKLSWYEMTKFEEWILRKIARRLVIQSWMHENNIIKYYKIIEEVARKEFNEDSKPTFDNFLTECFEKSLTYQYKIGDIVRHLPSGNERIITKNRHYLIKEFTGNDNYMKVGEV